jgi:hypothetical protein
MSYKPVLRKLERGEIDANAAYKEMFEPSIKEGGKRAFFVKMKVQVPEEGRGVNTFLKILFMIPIPLIFARLAIRLFGRKINESLDGVDFEVKDILDMIKYSRNTRIHIDSNEAQVDIKII